LVEELYGHGGIDICLSSGKKDEIFVWDSDVADAIEEEDGIVAVFLGGDHLGTIMLDLCTSDVVFEGAVDKDLPLDVYEHHGTQHLNYHTWIQIRSLIIT
jgi:hypothetical protein